ncbi:C45 family autoproteolytic acyltransferase/hydolase [Oceanobacillus jeddahense]|uniref:C45 family autoproteolytic acyltransferase/hydolase n=1 Tax=Oceanobacillus jeddahense TaxID=1462527 RepID=UPI003626B0C1
MKIEKQKRSTKSFPFYSFKGSHKEIGQQYGERCSDLIKKHLDYALKQLEKEIKVLPSKKDLENAALQYRPYVIEYAPSFDDEIQGLAEGANISLGEAYFLQLRAEMVHHFDSTDHECTTFALQAEATKDNTPLVGQNVDLPPFYAECNVVVEIIPNDGPKFLMLTPAGQISFIGINDQGVGVCGNFITCDGWRKGFPRYMLTRLALIQSSVEEAVIKLENTYRASSRNIIMVDSANNAIDLEVTPDVIGKVLPKDGFIAHSNHFLSSEVYNQERKVGEDFENSAMRRFRMHQLIESRNGDLDVTEMQSLMRDRTSYPHTICRMPGDFGIGTTSSSVIAAPSKGEIWVAIGPPENYEYKRYTFSS